MPMMLQDLADLVQNPQPQAPPGQLPPGSPPDGLLAQLMRLGSVDQRHKLFQQQFDQGNELAAGAPVDYSKGRGGPLALAGIANLVSAGLGGYQQGKATGGLRDLVGEQDAGRTAAAQGRQNLPMSDLASALTASPADAPAKFQASQDAIEQRSRYGDLMSMTGDPQLVGVGKSLAGEAGRDRETMLGMPQARQQLAGGDIKNQEAQADLAAKLRGASTATSPIVANAGAALLKKMGFSVPDGASAGEIAAIVPEAQKQYAEDTKRMTTGKYTVTPTGDILDTHSGTVKPGGGTSSTGGLTPEAIDQAARNYLKGGPLPSLGKGNLAGHLAILKRAAELSPDGDIVGNKATAKADAASLSKLQTQADGIESFENTALKNLDNFRNVAKGVVDVGSPLFNAPLRSLDSKLMGNPKQSQFNAARTVAIQEISKVLGGAVAGGVVSDSQRHEVEGLISGDASLAQIDAVAETLKQDMANRKSAVASQIATIKGRMSGKPAATEAPAAAPAAVRKFTRGADGKLVEVK